MQVLNWGELSLPYDFVWKAVIHHMNHIEYECLEFVAVWLFRFHEVTLFSTTWIGICASAICSNLFSEKR